MILVGTVSPPGTPEFGSEETNYLRGVELISVAKQDQMLPRFVMMLDIHKTVYRR